MTWEQHCRYFQPKGILDDPRLIFDRDLLAALRQWRADQVDVVLGGDFNDDIYRSPFAKALAGDDINMIEQYLTLFGEEAPHLHVSGMKKPLMGVFASPGVRVSTVFMSKHHLPMGVGDHRFHVYNFEMTSILGTETPTVTRVPGHLLQYRNYRVRANYTKLLMQITSRHRMYAKACKLQKDRLEMTTAEFQLAYNQFDRQLTELMLGAEKCCHKKRICHLEWSPIIGLCLRKLHIYRWIIRSKQGRRTNFGNLVRTCANNGIKHPGTMTLDEAETGEAAMVKRLQNIKEQAPQLRQEHLQNFIDKARAVGDKARVEGIIRIMRKESQSVQYKRMWFAFGKRKGSAASRVAFYANTGPDPIYNTKDNLEINTKEHLGERFSEARLSPFCSGQLLSDVGLMGDGPEVDAILEGTYEFPDNCDKNAIWMMKEAARVYTKTVNDMVNTRVTSETFHNWWLRANKNIQSSKLGCHFAHYMAAA